MSAEGLRLLVVGASSGIGHAVAQRAAERGPGIAVAARRLDLLSDLADRISGHASNSTLLAWRTSGDRRHPGRHGSD